MQWRSALVMMLMLVSPFLAFAQTDDIYFVPTKSSEKQTIVVERVSDKYNIVDETKVTVRNVDEYNRRYTYTNDPEVYVEDNYGDEYVAVADDYQDYDYSTRIIRFRNPRRAISNIYWDLAYTSYVNDWYIYDNGYSIDIYPTINNPLYYLTDFAWNSLTWYNWRYWYNRYSWNYSYWDWYHPGYYCSYSPYWYHHHHNSHWYNSYWNNHIHANRWHSGRNLRNSITRGGISARKHDTRGAGYGNDRGRVTGRGDKKDNGGVNLRGDRRDERNSGKTVAGVRNDKKGNTDNRGVNLRGNTNVRNNNDRNGKSREIRVGGKNNENGRKNGAVGNNGARRQQPARTGVNGSKNNENSRKNGAVNSNTGARRQQPARTTVNGNRNNESSRKNGAASGNTGARRQQPARSVNNGNGTTRNSAVNTPGKDVRQRGERGGASAQGQGSVNRRSSSTGNYNRQSSTNATRSRSTSTQTRSSSVSSASGSRSRGGGSSYSSSGSSSRSSSSSYSGGSSSRSGGGGSSSGGGGSRGSGGGGSRSGGRGR